jgi:iron complex outermembrane receptor protein
VICLNPTLVCSLLFGAATALAGQQRPATPLEEIVITGDREDRSHSQTIQAGTFRGADELDTPLTVSVITGNVMHFQQDQDLGEVLRNSAGVTGLLVSPTVYTNAAIRGIPINGRTNVKLNGSLSIVNFIDLPLEDKARVEVLKGVSALYYGFATPSGIVNLVTHGVPVSPELSASISGNQYGQIQAAVDGGTTLGVLGVRGTVARGSIDSGIRHTRGNRALQSVVIELKPSDTVRLDLNVEHITKSVTEPTILQGPQKRALLLTELPHLPDPRDNPGSEDFVNRAHELNLLARMRWIVAAHWTLTAETGLSNAERDRRFSTLGEFDPVTGLGTMTAQAANGQLYRNAMVRGDVAGDIETGPISHQLVFGVSWQRSRQYFPSPRIIADATNSSGCVQLGLRPDCVQSAFDPIVLRDMNIDGNVSYDPSRDTKNVDTGLYAFDRLALDHSVKDRVQVILGIRKSVYRQFVAVDRGRWSNDFSADPVTVSAGAIFRPIPSASLYLSYIEGLESQPPAPNLTVNQGEILPPGKSKQTEFGAKVRPFGNLLLLNIAYFDIDRHLTYVNSANRFVEDGIGHYSGIEAGVEGEVARDFSVIGSTVFLDAREAVPGDRVINGKRVENSARWQWSVSGEYRFSKWLRGAGLNAGIFFTGRRPINPENSLFVPGYTTVDIGTLYGMKIAGVFVTARINVNNLFSRRYVAATGANLLSMGIPRTIRFSVTTKIL